MNSIVTGLYNFVTSTVVPTVTEQATNLVGGATAIAGGAAQALTQISQTALEWGSGSEDATASSEVFSWEQQKPQSTEQKSEGETSAHREEAGPSSANTSIEWEVVQENPEDTGPVKHNQFEIVQNDYDWMKNSN
ncbi:unnamed protein product [Caenorhabditis nigoni]|uniref:Uncharacterized protein n=1 Tax=Caenorhabditis nigoni TaxID=1611254 RepID=A0A2G5VJN8_9PELO|nr:hypothetical protein B9Z55_002269 [Caenorhabditis nigoni]